MRSRLDNITLLTAGGNNTARVPSWHDNLFGALNLGVGCFSILIFICVAIIGRLVIKGSVPRPRPGIGKR